jgi:hypothetical protein
MSSHFWSHQSFPYAQGKEVFSAMCDDGKTKGPASVRRKGPTHKVNLTSRPALDPRTSGGRGRAAPLPSFWREVLEAFQLLFILWRAIVPFARREGLFRWASTRFIFGAGSTKEGDTLFFSSSARPLGAAFSTPSQEAHTPSLTRRRQLCSQGDHRGGPFGPLHPSFNQAPLHSAPGFSPFPHGNALDVRHAICTGDWAASLVLRDTCSQVPVP